MIKKNLFPQSLFLELVISEVSRSLRRGYAFSLVAVHVESRSKREKVHLAVSEALLAHLRLSDFASRFPNETYLLLLPETGENFAPLVEERAKALAESACPGFLVRTARRTYSSQSTQDLPTLAALEADLRALLEAAASPKVHA